MESRLPWLSRVHDSRGAVGVVGIRGVVALVVRTRGVIQECGEACFLTGLARHLCLQSFHIVVAEGINAGQGVVHVHFYATPLLQGWCDWLLELFD